MGAPWRKNAAIKSFEPLKEEIRTDVLVIGGGMTGLLCAYMLRQAGIDCVLAEAKRIGSGITANTTAKITSQHGLIYDRLLRSFGAEKAGLYLQANETALRKYRELCSGIDCGFEEKDAFVYSLDSREKLEKEITALDRLGFPAKFAERLPLPFLTAGAVEFPKQAQFNPLRFMSAITEGLRIYEHTAVQELIERTAVTKDGKIFADNIIIATHFPFINKHGSYFLKMYQQRAYVIAVEGGADLRGMYVDGAEGGMSFRNAGELLLIGGGGRRTGKKSRGWQELQDFAEQYYPEAEEKYRWAAQDCMTLDGVPYIGKYSERTRELYTATGFNKWGMTGSMVAAMMLADLVQGKENPYAALFSPSRSMLRPQLAINAFEAAISLLTPSVRRCPHMGCALKWNASEHTWDCPCHGSRFGMDGRLLENPSMGGLKK